MPKKAKNSKNVAKIELPPKLLPVFSAARGDKRYRVAYGGRGSGKSYSFALMAAVFGYAEKLRILCTRELQVSIKESMHAELANVIRSVPWLEAHYEVGQAYIRGRNGTEFMFRGLRHNMSSLKSMAQIDLCIVEEATDVPMASWRDLEPTIRAPKSEIWVVFNPRYRTDPVDEMFIQNTPPRAAIAKLNYADNPWFSSVLEEQRRHAQKVMDDAIYRWVWKGDYLEATDAQVLRGKFIVQEFEPDQDKWDGPMYGVDWGFSADPTAALRAWVKDNNLYVDYEYSCVGLELDATADALANSVPGIEAHVARADCARPETISYVKRNGLPKLQAAPKWPGSVNDGVAHLKSYEQIIIHPRCTKLLDECRLYSYKVNRLTGDVMPEIQKGNDHLIDALRYALSPLIRRKKRTVIYSGDEMIYA